jgi:hypothetical protein
MNECEIALRQILARLDQLAEDESTPHRTRCMVAALHVHQAIEAISDSEATTSH